MATVPLGLGDAATEAALAHSGKPVSPAQSLNILSVNEMRKKSYWLRARNLGLISGGRLIIP